MDLQTRKLELIKIFLNLQNEDIISRIENLLKKQKKNSVIESIKPFSIDELNRRIDQSESDFCNNRFKRSSELLEKYK